MCIQPAYLQCAGYEYAWNLSVFRYHYALYQTRYLDDAFPKLPFLQGQGDFGNGSIFVVPNMQLTGPFHNPAGDCGCHANNPAQGNYWPCRILHPPELLTSTGVKSQKESRQIQAGSCALQRSTIESRRIWSLEHHSRSLGSTGVIGAWKCSKGLMAVHRVFGSTNLRWWRYSLQVSNILSGEDDTEDVLD